MFKLTLSIILTFLIISSTVATVSANNLIYSTDKTADALIYTGYSNFTGILIITDGSNTVTVDIYDGTSTSGTKIIPTIVFDPADNTNHVLSFLPPIKMNDGIYIDVTTAGTVTYKVYYNTIKQ